MENSRFDARKTWRTIFLVLLDILTVNATAAIALWVSYEFNLHYDQPYFYLMRIVKLIPVFTVLTLVAIASFKLYNSLWEFASVSELWHIAFACVVAVVIEVIGHNVLARIAPEAALSGLAPMPKRYYIIHFFLLCVAFALWLW